MTKNSIFRFTLTVTSCAAMTGCAIYDPYIRFRETDKTYDHHTDAQSGSIGNGGDSYYGRLPSARDDAGRLAGRYERAAATHAMVKTSAATILLAAATGGLYGAATHPRPNSDLIPAIGFGSAGILAAGSLLVSPTRQDIYLAGRDALICARSATDAYLIYQTDYDRYLSPEDTTGFQHDLQDVSEKYLIVLEIGNTTNTDKPLRAAEAQISLSTKTQADAESLRSRVMLAGPRLRGQVESINNEVDKQLRTTEPDFAKIKAALALTPTQTWPQPVGVPPAAIKPENAANSATPVQLQAIRDLTVATAKLATSTRAVESFVRSMIIAETAGPILASCKVKAVTPVLQVHLTSPAQVKQDGSAWTVSVTTSEGNPSAVADPSDGLTVKSKVGAGAHDYIFEVTADKTAIGTHVLHIVSASESERQDVPFQIVDTTGKPAVPPAPDLAAPPPWLKIPRALALKLHPDLTDPWNVIVTKVKDYSTNSVPKIAKPWLGSDGQPSSEPPANAKDSKISHELQNALDNDPLAKGKVG